MEFELDLSGVDSMERLEAGDRTPPGWYTAKLTDFYKDHDHEGQAVFEYTIHGGTWDGTKVFDRVTDPRSLDEPKKQKSAGSRIRCLGARLGLLTEADLTNPKAKVKFLEAIGREVVLHIQQREYQDAAGVTKQITGIAFDGVFPPDHPKIPADVRQRLELPPARVRDAVSGAPKAGGGGESAGAAGGKPVDNFEDL